jgi:hypothetical protein
MEIDMQLKTLFHSQAGDEELPGTTQEATHASWREASDRVAEAYRSWAAAPRAERFLAHAAYLAALEREERAAHTYRLQVDRERAAGDGRAPW